MKRPVTAAGRWLAAAALLAPAVAAWAGWRESPHALGWEHGGRTAWRFHWDPAKGKPFFHPLAIDGTDLTSFQPVDHPWHYGLWFSWKLINGANYWEESRETGRAEGLTRWTAPAVHAQPDGRATIRLALEYVHPSGRIDLREARELEISAVGADGGFSIDWRSVFTAGADGAVLDRTPMPHEPDGKINGGYAGLGIRLAPAPLAMEMATAGGTVTAFTENRARPASAAAAASFRHEGRPVGGIAVLSAANDLAPPPPWYLIHTPEMRFLCAAVLAPAVRRLAPGETWSLRYRILVRSGSWTPELLREELARRPFTDR